MNKIKLNYKVGTALRELIKTIGKAELYKFENLLCHYKHSNKYEGETQKQISILVDFVRNSEKNRITYYNALSNDFTVLEEEKDYSGEPTYDFYKNEGVAIFIKGKMVYGIHPDNLHNNLKALKNGDLKIKWWQNWLRVNSN
ncbi:hypothetical protein ACMX2I_10970 [Bacillus sp. SW14]|uniref:hypothetical protein n=1 Tax=Bacillus sp. SW14 TaxID=3391618 RepID=UPI0039E6C3CA